MVYDFTIREFWPAVNKRKTALNVDAVLSFEGAAVLARELHESGVTDSSLCNHPDWGLFGMTPSEGVERLDGLGEQDGVIINAAPLHKLFRPRSWAKHTEECWKKLGKDDYDRAHLAYTIRPDRVREVCKRDRSIAIAHGLEELCERGGVQKLNGGKARTRKKS